MSQHMLRCEQLFDGFRWYNPGFIQISAGQVIWVGEEAPAGVSEAVPGVTLPGMPNLHSHAFQRALAGLTEHRVHRSAAAPSSQNRSDAAQSGGDSFWTWRDLMYRFVEHITPEDVEIIAEQLYLELLEAGYTSVAEFHYLHHGPGGEPYSDLAELGRRLIRAARAMGLRLTLLPVYYESAGFGPLPIQANQRRFYNQPERFLRLWELLAAERDPLLSVGVAPHSLRAAPLDGLRDVLQHISSRQPECRIHLHIAEQTQEVEACLAHHGARPVELLFDQQQVDARWCLVHATHLASQEILSLAKSGAVAGLCPTTEANLGDGLFPLAEYLGHGGRFGIGSDSHVSVSPVEELRWLEYGQRLTHRARNVALGAQRAESHTGRLLYAESLLGGAQALGGGGGHLSPGCHADLLVLDPAHPSQLARSGDSALDSWLFAANRPAVQRVMVGGKWQVTDGRHPRREVVAERFARCLARLLSAA